MEDVSLFRLAATGMSMMRERSPVDTGNLRNNGIRLVQTGANEYTISIGGTYAPYAVYTNEVWIAPRWKGKPNPNEHWIDKGVEDVVDEICKLTGGRLSTIDGVDDRWTNKSYWESAEGIERLKRYKISDYKSAVR